MVASDSITNMGVDSVSLSQVIFSFGVAPEYEPYDVVESEIWQKYAQGLASCSRSYLIDGTTQIGKSPAMPPPIWKKPTPAPVESSLFWQEKVAMYSMPLFTMFALASPTFTCEAKMLPNVESSCPGTTTRRRALAAASSQHSSGLPW